MPLGTAFKYSRRNIMAKTTFSGPVRSEDTFKTIRKNSTTGAITEIITLGDGPVAL